VRLVFEGPGRVALQPDEVDPPGPDEVLIETECTLISTGTEVSVLHRRHDPASAWAGMQEFPFHPGYNHVGTVVAGPAEWVGVRVASHAPHASLVRWPAAELRRIPAGVGSGPAALAALAEVALNAVRRSPAGIGSRCAVLGLGLVGQLTARLLAVAGASVVWCSDPDPRRTALVPDRVPFRLGLPDSADVTFEASGHPAAMVEAGRVTRVGGTIAVVSSPSGPVDFDFHDACNRKSLTIVGSHYFSHPPAGQRWDARDNGECFLELVDRDPASYAPLISEELPIRDAPARYRTLLSDPPVAGVLLRWRQ
jgi:threonine dehydrogenase-like Zn-dependent dehydrogenase